jgi:hypothetical protein
MCRLYSYRPVISLSTATLNLRGAYVTITLDLPPQVVQARRAEAKAKGLQWMLRFEISNLRQTKLLN